MAPSSGQPSFRRPPPGAMALPGMVPPGGSADLATADEPSPAVNQQAGSSRQQQQQQQLQEDAAEWNRKAAEAAGTVAAGAMAVAAAAAAEISAAERNVAVPVGSATASNNVIPAGNSFAASNSAPIASVPIQTEYGPPPPSYDQSQQQQLGMNSNAQASGNPQTGLLQAAATDLANMSRQTVYVTTASGAPGGAVTGQPRGVPQMVVVGAGGSEKINEWQHGLCGCFKNSHLCLLGYFCSCYVVSIVF